MSDAKFSHKSKASSIQDSESFLKPFEMSKLARDHTALNHEILDPASQNERQNFLNLFQKTPEMVCIFRGPEHVLEFVNDAHVKVLGFDATGMSVREAQPESIGVHRILDSVYQTGQTASLNEIEVTLKNRVRYFNLTYSARRNAKGSIDGVMVLGLEVTELILGRNRSSELLELSRQSEEQLRLLANSIPQIAWMSDPDGRPIWYNNRWRDYTGLSAENDMADVDLKRAIDPQFASKITVLFEKCKKTGEAFEMELPLKGVDGKYRWFLVRMEALCDSSGKVLRWIGTSTDIDERKRISENNKLLADASAVFSQTLNYEKTLQSLASLIVERLADWCSIAFVEQGAEPREIAVAHPNPEMLKLAQEMFRDYPTNWNAPSGAPNVVRTGKSEVYTDILGHLLEKVARDERHVELIHGLKIKSVMIVPLIARNRVLGAITFVASELFRSYTENDLQVAEEIGRRAGVAIDNALLFEAEQKAVLSRDEFMSIASHELKTPLTSLKLQAQMRLRNLASGNMQAFSEECLKKMIREDCRQIDRIARLIEDMLDISRIRTGKLSVQVERVDLSSLVNGVLERHSPQLELSKSKVKVTSADTVEGYWDRFRIEQVVANLITNAVRYGNGSLIEIEIKREQDFAVLIVRDRGMGIAKENHSRIFERFERAVSANEISGLGLGLFIVRQILEVHGGTISVESELGKGSSFRVKLPIN
jgi:PAS domain S-box-containing protein